MPARRTAYGEPIPFRLLDADTHEFWTARLAVALADLPDAWTAGLLADFATEHR